MKKIIKKKFKTCSPKEFYDEESGTFTFPFVPLDPTPGGQSLGRIQWFVELIPGGKQRKENFRRLGKIHVWAVQTRDERYKGKIFEISTFAECMTTRSSLDKLRAYAPWRIMFCHEHNGAVILDAYPQDYHTKLVIENRSSISTEINFE